MQLDITFEAEDGTEIELTLEVSLTRNGIGSYEFHGQRCYDRGELVIDGCDIETISDEAYRAEADKWIDEHMDEIEEKAVAQADEDYWESRIEQAEANEER